METSVRRVITGDRPDGTSQVVNDDVMALSGGVCTLWGSDSAPTLPSDGTLPACPSWFAPPGGSRAVVFTIPPEGSVNVEQRSDFDGQVAEEGGWHSTDTVDILVVLSGEVSHECETGSEVALHPGDVLIQNGTRHTWHNYGPDAALLCGFMVGAQRV
jgi:mannose-6-phosphate isomerase-like protein (cupin superfamily)